MNSRDLMEAARALTESDRAAHAGEAAPRRRHRVPGHGVRRGRGCSWHVGVHLDRGPVAASTSCRGRERGTEQDDRRESRAGARKITLKPLPPIMPGFVHNPWAWMARAAVFVLSSAWEGLPTVVIESLAVGCPVVSTDCPGGSAEILDGGAYGRLAPVGGDEALAEAIIATLDEPPPRDLLRRRARHFSTDRMIDRYLDLLLGERP